MLCPNCGKNVGDKPTLCPDCLAKRDGATIGEEATTETAANEATINSDNLPAISSKEAGTGKKATAVTAESDRITWTPFLVTLGLLLLLVLLLGFGAYWLLSKSPVQAPPPVASQGTPVETPTSIATPVESISPKSESPHPSSTPDNSLHLSFNNSDWSSAVGLILPDRSVVVGLSKSELNMEDFQQVLHSPEQSKVSSPLLVLSYSLAPAAKEFTTTNTKGLKVTYYDADQFRTGVSFSYVLVKKDLPVAIDLRGELVSGETIHGSSKQSAEKLLADGKRLHFAWDVRYDVLVSTVNPYEVAQPSPTAQTPTIQTTVAPTATVTPKTTEATPGESSDIRPLANDELGVISSDDVETSIKEAFALYYPETGSVSIGLYGQALDDSDREEIRKKRILTSFINGKRASLVFVLDFQKGGTEAAKGNLLGYTAYFYRDASGLFFFPGSFDSKSVRRAPKDFQKGEFLSLSGKLQGGGTLSIKTSGDNAPSAGHTKLGWNVSLSVVLNAAK